MLLLTDEILMLLSLIGLLGRDTTRVHASISEGHASFVFQDRTVNTPRDRLVNSHHTTECHYHLDMGVSVCNDFVFCVSTVEYQLNCIQTNCIIHLN